MGLSDLAIRRAKPADKPYKMGDRDGLYLLVTPSGSKLWRVNYQVGGKQKTLSIGRYPDFSLSQAREQRVEARKLLSSGVDPSLKKRLTSGNLPAGDTFGDLADEHIANLIDAGRSEATIGKNRWLLETLAEPLRPLPIKAIGAADILNLLKRIERSGRRETARRLRSAISRVFRHAIVNLRTDSDPTIHLVDSLRPPKVRSHPALVEPKAVGGLLRAIDEYDGWPTITAALQFSALTFVRPGEIRLARWDEIDVEGEVWNIPAHRMKGKLEFRNPHDVPLSRQAIIVLNRLSRQVGREGLIFSSIRSPKKPISENAMNSALRRMGFTKDEMTPHGFRSMASTILNESGRFREDVIEFQLAHVEGNKVRRAYNRAKYWDERIEMMQAWADMLDEFRLLR